MKYEIEFKDCRTTFEDEDLESFLQELAALMEKHDVRKIYHNWEFKNFNGIRLLSNNKISCSRIIIR